MALKMSSKETYIKLANAAYELADEFERGNGPELGVMRLFFFNGKPCCALGHVLHKAGINSEYPGIRYCYGYRASKVTNVNDSTPGHQRKQALIKPLRHLADGWKEYAEKLSE